MVVTFLVEMMKRWNIVKAILKEIDSSKIAMNPVISRRVKSRFDEFGVYTVKNSTVPLGNYSNEYALYRKGFFDRFFCCGIFFRYVF